MRRSGGIGRLSLSGTDRRNEEQQSPAQAADLRAAAYTDADMRRLWDAFIARHPSEVILVNTMRASRPCREDGSDRFTVTVENAAQQEKLAEVMPTLLAELRDGLGNDHVTLDVVINQGESGSHTWSEREVLARMIENNPALKNFIAEFRLNIG